MRIEEKEKKVMIILLNWRKKYSGIRKFIIKKLIVYIFLKNKIICENILLN